MNLEYQLFLCLMLCCVLVLVLPVGSVYWFFIRDDDTSVNDQPKLIMQVTGGGQTINEKRKTTNQLIDSSISYE
jgi:hypothetical protein